MKPKLKSWSAALVGAVMAGVGLYLTFGVHASGASHIYVTPASGSYQTGGTISLQVRVNSGTTGINTAGIVLNYPATLLTYQSASTAGSPYDTGLSIRGGNGSVTVQRGTTGGQTVGDQLLATVVFSVGNGGTAAIGGSNCEVYPASGTGVNDCASFSGASYSLKAPAPTPAPAPAPTPTPAPVPTPAPPSTGGTAGGSTGNIAPKTIPTPSSNPSTSNPNDSSFIGHGDHPENEALADDQTTGSQDTTVTSEDNGSSNPHSQSKLAILPAQTNNKNILASNTAKVVGISLLILPLTVLLAFLGWHIWSPAWTKHQVVATSAPADSFNIPIEQNRPTPHEPGQVIRPSDQDNQPPTLPPQPPTDPA
jgi:hypothetical protein